VLHALAVATEKPRVRRFALEDLDQLDRDGAGLAKGCAEPRLLWLAVDVEELAFRGILQEGLLKCIVPEQVVYVNAFLFAIIHMSLISFFWLLPFAIWLGKVRMKEGTIWYGVVIHFLFNTTACLLEFRELGVL